MIKTNSLATLFEEATTRYEGKLMNSLTDGSASYTFDSFGRKTREISEMLSSHGVGAGDKVAIFSAGHPDWVVAFFACTAFGRVAVPILPDFTENEANNVLSHSECKALFVSRKLSLKVSAEMRSRMNLVIELESLEPIHENGKTCAPAPTAIPAPEDLAVLIYTSGTSGKAKGVMLTHRNLCSQLISGEGIRKIGTKDVMLSVLPLAHAYEMSLGMLYPFASGTAVYYLPKPPTPSVLMKAMAQVHPTAMLIVPLIIEKVYRNVVLPKIKASKALSWLDQHAHTILCRLVGMELKKAFGGRMSFLGIGGAKLDIDVERFLHTARFPYFIGYGLTETSPLLAVASYRDTVPGAAGKPVIGVELKINNPNSETGEGEIIARGANVMPGYYLDPERTAAAFTEDGWFRTNDLAAVDASGRYFIKGRLSNMILGPSGENIYPEEIEKIFNEMKEVDEAIVVERKGKLVGLVCVAEGVIDWDSLDSLMEISEVEEVKKMIMNYVNERVRISSRISEVQIMTEPFEKTATMKIRRFLYNDSAPVI